MQPPFNLDVYEYEKGGYYPAFKSAVDEKICAAMVSEAVAQSLRAEGLVYHTADPIAVADIGCGPADSIQMYLSGARHEPGFDVHATDYSKDYTAKDGLAEKNLQAAKMAGGPLKINSFSVTNGDAFNGRLNATLGTGPNHFPLTFISHMFYHTNPENLGTMLADVSQNVLAPEGVGILFHLEKKPDSFQYFRSKYGRKSESMDGSDTPSMNVDNPPQVIADACATANIPCHTARFDNNYYFAPMAEKYWEMFKHPEQYHLITDKAALANLKQLYFIPQRAANEFAADTGDRGLAAFVDEVRAVIAPNQTEFARKGGYMALAETVQLIGNANTSEETRGKIARVASSVQKQLPDITERAFREWQKSGLSAAVA
ncbi:MAG: class I SAM-dependent methyltransferase [Alphaproteobacteria bacterium]